MKKDKNSCNLLISTSPHALEHKFEGDKSFFLSEIIYPDAYCGSGAIPIL